MSCLHVYMSGVLHEGLLFMWKWKNIRRSMGIALYMSYCTDVHVTVTLVHYQDGAPLTNPAQ
jgi:hypothetical protein